MDGLYIGLNLQASYYHIVSEGLLISTKCDLQNGLSEPNSGVEGKSRQFDD